MQNTITTKDFTINPIIIWTLAIANFVIFIFTLLHRPHSLELLLLDLPWIILVQVILISDIYKSKIHNKTFWISSMFYLAIIAPIIYLIRRKKLLGH